MFAALPTALQLFIAPLLHLLRLVGTDELTTLSSELVPSTSSLDFTLKHHHVVVNDSLILFADAPRMLLAPHHSLKTQQMQISKPHSQEAFFDARRNALLHMQTPSDLWTQQNTTAPDVQDRETLLTLARMTNNAYYEPSDNGWYTLGDGWANTSYPFGWEPDADGFRGYVFASEDNSTVVITIKGTSAGWIIGDNGRTRRKDKLNDNLLFSCCCARVGPTWTPVCDCYSGSYKCSNGCVQRALTEESLFYNVAINLYNNVTYLYPQANIWIVGHSLGGSLSSLVGATFGVPAVAFEAPAERLAASRLHLPSPPSTQHITHVYHTADPIAMGVCNGITSVCAIAGYAMETKCHLGKIIKYDTVTKRNWAVDIRTHSIRKVIETILAEDWEPKSENSTGRQVPELSDEEDCIDCFNWDFG